MYLEGSPAYVDVSRPPRGVYISRFLCGVIDAPTYNLFDAPARGPHCRQLLRLHTMSTEQVAIDHSSRDMANGRDLQAVDDNDDVAPEIIGMFILILACNGS